MINRFSLFVVASCLLAVITVLRLDDGAADEPKGHRSDGSAAYSEQPGHPWDRLHAALLIRTGPDGVDYGHDRLEPLLWNESTHLLKGEGNKDALAALEELDRRWAECPVEDPVKRAVLQRDVWLVSSWLGSVPHPDARLQRALDAALLRLALPAAKIAELPDNYEAAVASKRYADRFDPDRPEQAYLPANLFDPAGPWVCVGPPDGPTAPFHLDDRGTNPFGNSTFLVFLKLPGGREKSLDFLKRLAALDEPFVLNRDEMTRHVAPLLPHPEFPTWPKGTEVALVRRALLVSSERRVIASPLTEGVQLRVITTDPPELTPTVLDRAFGRRPPGDWQATFEFQLRRADLFAGVSGGLRDVSAERDFKTGFNSHLWDEFTGQPRGTEPFPERSQPFASNRESCATCHNFPGVFGFNSIREFAFGMPFQQPQENTRLDWAPPGPTTVAAAEKKAVARMEGRPVWAAFVQRSGG